MSEPTEPRQLRATPTDDLSGWLMADDPAGVDHPLTLSQEPPRSSRPLRLYLAAAIVLLIALSVALLAPKLFGSGDGTASVDDDFERVADSGLGELDDDTAWEPVTGTFAIEDGKAVVREANDKGPRTVTVIDIGATNGEIEATVGNATSGWGVVFRYANPFNYWYVQAAPEYGVLNVARMSGGQVQQIGATALAGLRPGTKVTVILTGANIEIEVDGTSVFTLTSDQLFGATRAGLIGLGDPEGASWDAFRATPNEENPGPNTIRLPGDATTTTATEGEGDEEEPAEDDGEPTTTSTDAPASTTTTTAG